MEDKKLKISSFSEKDREQVSKIKEADKEIKAWAYLPDSEVSKQERLKLYPESDSILNGLYFGVKDIIDVHGMPTNYGAVSPSSVVKKRDAAVVGILRRAGAVPIGKTVTSEFAFRHPGETRNPHN